MDPQKLPWRLYVLPLDQSWEALGKSDLFSDDSPSSWSEFIRPALWQVSTDWKLDILSMYFAGWVATEIRSKSMSLAAKEKPTSYYQKFWPHLTEQIKQNRSSQERISITPDTYAEQVVAKCDVRSPPAYVYAGGFAWSSWLLSFGPVWLLDWLIDVRFATNQVRYEGKSAWSSTVCMVHELDLIATQECFSGNTCGGASIQLQLWTWIGLQVSKTMKPSPSLWVWLYTSDNHETRCWSLLNSLNEEKIWGPSNHGLLHQSWTLESFNLSLIIQIITRFICLTVCKSQRIFDTKITHQGAQFCSSANRRRMSADEKRQVEGHFDRSEDPHGGALHIYDNTVHRHNVTLGGKAEGEAPSWSQYCLAVCLSFTLLTTQVSIHVFPSKNNQTHFCE